MKRKKHLYIIGFIFLCSTEFMSFRGLSLTTNASIYLFIEIAIFIVCLLHKKELKAAKYIYPSYRYVFTFLALTIPTWLSCYVFHGQSIYQSFGAFVSHYLLVTYFLLVIFDMPKKDIVKIIIILALIRTGLTYCEQFTYPNVPFTFRIEKYDDFGNFRTLEIRNGFYRFLIADGYFLVLFAAFYSFVQLSRKISLFYLLCFMASCFGIYMDGTRQVMIAGAIPIAFYVLFKMSKRNYVKTFIFITVVLLLSYFYFGSIFGESIEKTDEQSAENFGRMYSYKYFLENIWDYPALFGNGVPFGKTSEWGKELSNLSSGMIRPRDVGVLGAIFMIGWILVLYFIYFIYEIVIKNWRYIDDELKMYFISLIVMLPLIFPLFNGTMADYEMFLACLFYMTDRSIINNKTRKIISQS